MLDISVCSISREKFQIILASIYTSIQKLTFEADILYARHAVLKRSEKPL